MKAMIPSRKFELRKAQTAATLAVIPGAATQGVILEVATQAVILEAIPAGALGEVIPTQGAEVGDLTGDDEIPGRILKITPKCSR
jgi:hypothetical protein